MPSLILFRHGKSDWDNVVESDHERPLAKRGRLAAKRMGRLLSEAGRVPDRAVTSSAVRARSTLELAVEAGDWQLPIDVSGDLYGAGVESTIDLVRRESDQTATLLLTGHEPTWSLLSSALIGGGSVRVPTAAMVGIDLLVTRWEDVSPGSGRLAFLLIPRLVN